MRAEGTLSKTQPSGLEATELKEAEMGSERTKELSLSLLRQVELGSPTHKQDPSL